jgi:5-methylcytosine-specific restriction protein B
LQPNLKRKIMTDYRRFKTLLEYFVTHLRYVTDVVGLNDQNVQRLIPSVAQGSFKKQGQGKDGDKIQEQIYSWDTYSYGKIFINLDARHYKDKGCYLNWDKTGVNVGAVWDSDDFKQLRLVNYDGKWESYGDPVTLEDLGLFDGQEPNEIAKRFFDDYCKLYKPQLFYMMNFIKLLESNKNLILTGAPGTGKTYLAKEVAKKMIFGETPFTEVEFKIRCQFVQFHPSYDYTDFVEGLRATPPDNNGNIGFKRIDGVFKTFCKNAIRECKYKNNEEKDEEEYDGDKSKKFVFIIDEINRGEISKIFGELFYSIEPTYRGKIGKVKTQYDNLIEYGDVFKDGFYIPENVYIIGTMNDIDRSVESFDFAMRRRFVWEEITAEKSQNMIQGDEWENARNKMDALNKAIWDGGKGVDGLNSSYHIGAAYFRTNLPENASETQLDGLWKNHLKPLLKEYLRGRTDAETKLTELENAYNLIKSTTNGTTNNNGQQNGGATV